MYKLLTDTNIAIDSKLGSNHIYIHGLDSIVATMIRVMQRVVDFHEQHQLKLDAEDMIRFCCRYLGLALAHEVESNQGLWYQDMVELITTYTEQGEQFRDICTIYQENPAPHIKRLMQRYGPIVYSVVELTDFILKTFTHMVMDTTPYAYTAAEKQVLEIKLETEFQTIFTDTLKPMMVTIGEKQLAAPLDFFLREFSVMLGWCAGFFTRMYNTTPEIFLCKSLHFLQTSIIWEQATLSVVH